MTAHQSFWKTMFFLICLPMFGFGQKHWEASLSAGYTNYFGDLVEPIFTLNDAHLATQVAIRRQFDAYHSIRLNFLYGKISGDDRNSERLAGRGNSFETSIAEFSLIGEIDPFGKKRYPKKGFFRSATTPYFFAGLGVALGEPDVIYGNPDNIDATIDYPKLHVVTPMGMGLRFDLSEPLYLGLDLGVRITITDNIDGVQLSGNANRNDSYVFGGISFGYRLGKKSEVIPKEKKEPKAEGGTEK